jgi:hypothetical protein
MDAPAKLANPAAGRPGAAAPLPAPPAFEVRAAANDDAADEKRHTPENPLWVINIAMGAFFVVVALVMMLS